jgi:hypothetical protein
LNLPKRKAASVGMVEKADPEMMGREMLFTAGQAGRVKH